MKDGVDLEEQGNQAKKDLKDLLKDAFYDDLLGRVGKAQATIDKVIRQGNDIELSFQAATENALAREREVRREMEERFTKLEERLTKIGNDLYEARIEMTGFHDTTYGALEKFPEHLASVAETNHGHFESMGTRHSDLNIALSKRIDKIELQLGSLSPAAEKRNNDLLARLAGLEELITANSAGIELLNEAHSMISTATRELIQASEQRLVKIDRRTERLSAHFLPWVIAGAGFAFASVGWLSWAVLHHP